MFRVPVFRVHYEKLEEFVQKVYRTPDFDFLLAAGVAAGECPEYVVTGKLPDSLDWRRRIEHIKSGRRISRYVDLVLNLLAAEKYIPPGKYLIETRKPVDPIVYYTEVLRRTGKPDSNEAQSFKAAHSGNKPLLERIATLDKGWMERECITSSSTPNSLKTEEPST